MGRGSGGHVHEWTSHESGGCARSATTGKGSRTTKTLSSAAYQEDLQQYHELRSRHQLLQSARRHHQHIPGIHIHLRIVFVTCAAVDHIFAATFDDGRARIPVSRSHVFLRKHARRPRAAGDRKYRGDGDFHHDAGECDVLQYCDVYFDVHGDYFAVEYE